VLLDLCVAAQQLQRVKSSSARMTWAEIKDVEVLSVSGHAVQLPLISTPECFLQRVEVLRRASSPPQANSVLHPIVRTIGFGAAGSQAPARGFLLPAGCSRTGNGAER